MKVLIDLDSLLYASLYKVLSFSQIKDMVKKKYSREDMERSIVLEANERLANMCLDVCSQIADAGFDFEMTDVEYFLTSNIFSFRKQISQTYKANRKPNKWVGKLKKYIMDNENCFYSLDLESDDLISDRAKELNYQCVVATIDKDLNQIQGFKFDLYKEKSGQFNEFGIEIKQYRGIKYVTEDEAKSIVWQQMLEGDTADNIKGIKGIGAVKAKKIISEGNPFIRVAKEYFLNFGSQAKQEFKINYKLLKIGSWTEKK